MTHIDHELLQQQVPGLLVLFFDPLDEDGFPGSTTELSDPGFHTELAEFFEESHTEIFIPAVDPQPVFIAIPVQSFVIRKIEGWQIGFNGQLV
jgi:hypothetical protein